MKKATIGVVVPAYNEERVISAALASLKKVIPARHIYVVSDGSTDKTAQLAKQLVPNVLSLRKNRGKSGALKQLLKKYSLTDRYQYIFFFDADSRLDKNFITHIKKTIAEYKPACVVGTVTSDRKRFISAYRLYEYGFSHLIFKNAQNVMGNIIIAPGCASMYRADVLSQLDFSKKTLTEDMDFTLQVHRKKLGRIIYCRKAKVITQDPTTLSDYWHQINRWNTGFWQNFFLHKLYLPTSKVSLETLLLMADFGWWIAILVLAARYPMQLAVLYGSAMVLSTAIAIILSASLKQFWAIPYTPFFGIFHLLNLCSFVYSFFRYLFAGSKQLAWKKITRYATT